MSGVPRDWVAKQEAYERHLDEQAALERIAEAHPDSDPEWLWLSMTTAERERWIREAA